MILIAFALVEGVDDEHDEAGAGQALTARLIPLAQQYDTVALAGLTADEIEALKTLLVKVYDNLENLGDPTVADEPATAA